MTRKELDQRYQKICELVYSQQLKSALDELDRLIRFTTRADYFYQLETFTENYRTLLRYSFEGYQDPQQKSILNGLRASVLGVADEIRQALMARDLPVTRSERNLLVNSYGEDPLAVCQKVEEIFFQRELNRLIEETGTASGETSALPVHRMDQVFKLIWLTDKLAEPHQALLHKIIRSSQVEWYEKCLVVSALTLSLLNQFDLQKFLLLIEFTEEKENEVYQRALTGLVLGLLVYDHRIGFYPELTARLDRLSQDDGIIPEVELVLMQLLLAKETEKITREFEDEVLPEMKKMMPRIEDKLQLGDQGDEDDMEGGNPGWKDIIEEVPGLFEKIEKFSRMQMEGGDVFMSTFQMLKRFDFFDAMSNWFIPFHRGHPEIARSFSTTEEINNRLLESLENAFYICNSDKYSFAVNFRAIPDQQRTMIVTNFEAEFAQMKELASEEQMLDKSLATNAVFIQYIQDLYRFFKLYPARQEFDDFFRRKIRLNGVRFFREYFERPGFLEKLAAFHFEKEHFYDAAEVFEEIMKRQGPGREYFEKTGYCFQKTGRYRKAVECYRKAELYDGDRLWVLKKLGWCCLKLKDHEQALVYFRDASALQPDDLSLKIQVGQCYLHIPDYEQALHHYSALRYFAPDNLKVLRPIAYCQFATGKPELALEVYATVFGLSSDPSAYDLMNAAHVRLCLGQRQEAIALYRQSLNASSPGEAALLEAFDEDAAFLVLNGIPEGEIPLIRDYLMFQSE